MIRLPSLLLTLLCGSLSLTSASAAPPLKVLFLGDQGHHRPADRFRQLAPILAPRGIELTYTEDLNMLQRDKLASFQALMVYANIGEISPEQEQALLDYVAQGHGFLPIHCASYCFLNSDSYVGLVGAQFQKHGTGVFRTTVVAPDHPLVHGYGGFQCWDETYVHHRHNEEARTVLEVREDESGREPWTWVRTHGKGRIFYTAWGHDERTWSHPGFHNLIERGVRWSVGQDPTQVPEFTDQPAMTPLRQDVQPIEYVDARVPFYPAGEKWGTTTEPLSKMPKPLATAESMKHMVTPVGFELQLFASDPQIAKPICLAWDERGRLWIAETFDYPNDMQPADAGRDRIRICEDTDGDGRADKFTVFADGLSIPTSLAFAYGGVIIHQAPHTLFYRDNDGDDVADEKRILFSGWSTDDTHAGPSNLQYGLDNWYYGIVGYAGFEGEIAGQRHSFRTGFYRFRVEADRQRHVAVTQFEFLRNTNNNSWGVGFNEQGVLFGSTANGNPSEYMPVANRYYEAVRGWSSDVLRGIAGNERMFPITDKVRQVDYHGHFTAAAGHAVYTARTYPPIFWNQTAFVCEPTGHLVATFLLQSHDAQYQSRNAWNLLASNDEWSAPIVAEVGPDGHVWVIDWYNYIVQHNPTPAGFETGKGSAYVTELRDKTHGRIYRVVYQPAAGSYGKFSLRDATPPQLVAALGNDNLFWRRHAQRLLVERRLTAVESSLRELAQDPSQDRLGLNPGATHALWTLAGLQLLDREDGETWKTAVTALRHPSAGVRRAAVQVLPRTSPGLAAVLDSGVLRDMDGQVRLAALLALAEMPAAPAGSAAAAEALADAVIVGDRWLLDAATSAAAHDAVGFLQAIAARQGASRELDAPARERVAIVAEHFARQPSADQVPAVVRHLAGAEPGVAAAIVAGLARGWPADRPVQLDPAAEQALANLLPRLPADARSQLVMLAGNWGSRELEKYATELVTLFLAQIQQEELPEPQRIRAAGDLVQFRKADAEAVRQLLDVISPRTSPELARGILAAIGQSEAAAAGPLLIERLATLTPTARAAAIAALVRRADWTRDLLDGLEQGAVRLADLPLDQRQALAAHPNAEIAARAKKVLSTSGGLPSPDRQLVLAELTPLTQRTGNPGLGKEVFKAQCAKCHMHSGEGQKIGPDLTGMAVHPKLELLTQLIDPSRSVEGNYRVYTVVTVDGLVLTGLLAAETKTTLQLYDAEGKTNTILREDVEELVASPKSLMPEGFEKLVSQDDIANLLEFLTQRGKYLPLPLEKSATIVSTRGMFHSEDAEVERLVFGDWSPKTFEGVPFLLVDPRDGRSPNVILLNGPLGKFPPQMPKAVAVPCNAPAKAIHLLSGVSGWGFPVGERGSVSMIVRLHYADGTTEDHPLLNGEHFADYIRPVDVPQSQLAFRLRGQQVRYLAITPQRPDAIKDIEFVKGDDQSAPIVMAVTVETR